jgi:hypothetical protein
MPSFIVRPFKGFSKDVWDKIMAPAKPLGRRKEDNAERDQRWLKRMLELKAEGKSQNKAAEIISKENPRAAPKTILGAVKKLRKKQGQ